ncbi:serine hydroxymethyltransferase [candidate division MSBL1 archaeon SCGC-AAA382C18]|uniref:Serine hydroxymethyltransferase n=1 Tax=candidate division MSBL1 archaeon SCGC-AAA382C18 TaxID=1698281 RepID=A0A133VL52_9EURY|nr:serine hydroxymethyltransferase [candidate division MSBL1 archaeon SCGC-AAA382C18]
MAENELEKIQGWIRDHHEMFGSSIPLIASENVTSTPVKEAIVSDFSHRYAEGWPEERVYAGTKYMDKVELQCIDYAKDLFDVDFIDVRTISGVCSNLVTYTALTRPGDKMITSPISKGGHITMGPHKSPKTGIHIGGTAGSVHGLDVRYFEFDNEEMNIDPDKTAEKIRELEPDLCMFGASVFLFPHPIEEISDVAKEVDAKIAYDAAHVSGLIAGGRFQDPMEEGADIMSMSTHKTLPGPQHGMVAATEEHAEDVKSATFPSMVSNHHLHNVAGLTVALAEFKKYGEDYVDQVIDNSQALGEALSERGFDVVAEHKGYTKSHILLVDITNLKDTIGLGKDVEQRLEKANIILNRNLLPWDIQEDRHFENPGGIRIGTSEITRLGMKENEMEPIAEYMKRILMDEEDPEKVQEEVSEFRSDFQDVHYCFESSKKAHEYIEIGK